MVLGCSGCGSAPGLHGLCASWIMTSVHGLLGTGWWGGGGGRKGRG